MRRISLPARPQPPVEGPRPFSGDPNSKDDCVYDNSFHSSAAAVVSTEASKDLEYPTHQELRRAFLALQPDIDRLTGLLNHPLARDRFVSDARANPANPVLRALLTFVNNNVPMMHRLIDSGKAPFAIEGDLVRLTPTVHEWDQMYQKNHASLRNFIFLPQSCDSSSHSGKVVTRSRESIETAVQFLINLLWQGSMLGSPASDSGYRFSTSILCDIDSSRNDHSRIVDQMTPGLEKYIGVTALIDVVHSYLGWHLKSARRDIERSLIPSAAEIKEGDD